MTSPTDLTGIAKRAEAACEGIPGVTATVCPHWCTLTPGHPADSIHHDGRKSRGHGNVLFGAHLTGGADEYTDAQGVLGYVVELHAEGQNFTTSGDLLELAAHAIAAAQWLEANR